MTTLEIYGLLAPFIVGAVGVVVFLIARYDLDTLWLNPRRPQRLPAAE